MNLPSIIPPNRRCPALFLSLALLLTGGHAVVLAQDTNVVAAMAAVAHYPTDPAALPGKGPSATWTGLPAVWAGRHSEWMRTAENDKGAVVFLGDSITQGWNSLAQDFAGIHVANRGIGGDTTRGVLYRLIPDVVLLKPRAVVLLIGTNDVGNGADPKDVADNIESIIRELRRSSPGMPIIVCRVMPRSDQDLRFAKSIQELNSMIDRFTKNKGGIVECDTWSIFAEPNGGCQPAYFHDDLLHLNEKGYVKWAAALKPIFTRLNLRTDRVPEVLNP